MLDPGLAKALAFLKDALGIELPPNAHPRLARVLAAWTSDLEGGSFTPGAFVWQAEGNPAEAAATHEEAVWVAHLATHLAKTPADAWDSLSERWLPTYLSWQGGTGETGRSLAERWPLAPRHLLKWLHGGKSLQPALQQAADRFCYHLAWSTWGRAPQGSERHVQALMQRFDPRRGAFGAVLRESGPPSVPEEREGLSLEALVERAQRGDTAARDAVAAHPEVERRLRWHAWHYASRYASKRSVTAADCLQVAREGLLEAVATYDAARGTRFTTWAVKKARWRIQDYVDDIVTREGVEVVAGPPDSDSGEVTPSSQAEPDPWASVDAPWLELGGEFNEAVASWWVHLAERQAFLRYRLRLSDPLLCSGNTGGENKQKATAWMWEALVEGQKDPPGAPGARTAENHLADIELRVAFADLAQENPGLGGKVHGRMEVLNPGMLDGVAQHDWEELLAWARDFVEREEKRREVCEARAARGWTVDQRWHHGLFIAYTAYRVGDHRIPDSELPQFRPLWPKKKAAKAVFQHWKTPLLRVSSIERKLAAFPPAQGGLSGDDQREG